MNEAVGTGVAAPAKVEVAAPEVVRPPQALVRATPVAWAVIAAWWLVSRIAVFATALVVQYLRWPIESWYPRISERPFALLTSWDGRWYRMVADRGYLFIPHHQNDTAFFPLYPFLLRAGRAVGIPLNVTGLVIANLCFVVGLVAFYELCRRWVDDRTARRAAIYLAIFPVGYVFSMVYPESLVLVLIAGAGVLATRGSWGWAAACAAAAALTRPEALLLVLPLATLASGSWRTLDVRSRTNAIAAVLAAPAALVGASLYYSRTFGDALAFSSAQRAWGRHLSADGVYRAIVELVHAPHHHNTWLYRDAAFCVVYLVLLVVALRVGVPKSWIAASVVIVVLPLWSGGFTSDARFGLLALPAFCGLAAFARRRWVDIPLRIASLTLLVAATATILDRWP